MTWLILGHRTWDQWPIMSPCGFNRPIKPSKLYTFFTSQYPRIGIQFFFVLNNKKHVKQFGVYPPKASFRNLSVIFFSLVHLESSFEIHFECTWLLKPGFRQRNPLFFFVFRLGWVTRFHLYGWDVQIFDLRLQGGLDTSFLTPVVGVGRWKVGAVFCWTKNREFHPKMDGENHGKPY